ncbi:hypothetical protein KUCAC02_033146, partial [Chaenocephalus aceratus]
RGMLGMKKRWLLRFKFIVVVVVECLAMIGVMMCASASPRRSSLSGCRRLISERSHRTDDRRKYLTRWQTKERRGRRR